MHEWTGVNQTLSRSNLLGRALFPHLFPESTPPLNRTRYLFLDPRSPEFYPDWEKSARESVSALRLLAGHDPADGALMSLMGNSPRTMLSSAPGGAGTPSAPTPAERNASTIP